MLQYTTEGGDGPILQLGKRGQVAVLKPTSHYRTRNAAALDIQSPCDATVPPPTPSLYLGKAIRS